jgi:hypothetical protein
MTANPSVEERSDRPAPSTQRDVTAGVAHLTKPGITDPRLQRLWRQLWALCRCPGLGQDARVVPLRNQACRSSHKWVRELRRAWPSKGHGIYYSSNRIKFLGALMTFIDKNIGPPPENKTARP